VWRGGKEGGGEKNPSLWKPASFVTGGKSAWAREENTAVFPGVALAKDPEPQGGRTGGICGGVDG